MHWLHNFGNPWNGFKERSNSYIPQVFLDTKIMGLLLALITVFYMYKDVARLITFF